MGPGVPSVSDIDEIPEAPQVLPQGSVMVLGPGPKLGAGAGGLTLGCTESYPSVEGGDPPRVRTISEI